MQGLCNKAGSRLAGLAALISTATICLVFAGSAWAAAPANDNFANAIQITGNAASGSGSTVGATRETGEPRHPLLPEVNSVWYGWTATENGTVRFDVCDSGYGAFAAGYTGAAVNAMTLAASGACLLTMEVEAGTTYRISVNPSQESTEGEFAYRFDFYPVPDNDDFADATELVGNHVEIDDGYTFSATSEAGEPVHSGTDGDNSVWYEWTADSTGGASIDACAADFDSVLAVYTGDALDDLTRLTVPTDCDFRIRTAAGTTYRIAVDARDRQDAGNFSLYLDAAAKPANDDFAGAQVLAGASPSVTADNSGATNEPDEPDHGSDAQASVWYRWTAPVTSAIKVAGCADSFDVVYTVYTGTALDDLAPVKSSECGFGFVAEAGVAYYVLVDGWRETDTGEFSLSLVPFDLPDNDDFAGTRPVSGDRVDVTGNNVGATHESGEPQPESTESEASVWFKWTAPSSAIYTIDTCGSQFDTVLGIYTGSAVDDITSLESSDDSGEDGCNRRSAVTFFTTAGVEYKILVDGFWPPAIGDLRLRIYPGELVPLKYAVEVSKAGTGSGSVLSDNVPINCGPVCSTAVNDGTNVHLLAVPDPGSAFTGWTVGGCDWQDGTLCHAEAMSDRSVIANFARPDSPPDRHSLTVTKTGGGPGTVSSSPAGIDCGTICAASFDEGTTVELGAAPGGHSRFTGWTGACSGTGACQVTLGSDQTVGASFELFGDPVQPPGLAVKTGKVKLNKKKGTALIPATASIDAELTLTGKGVKTRKFSARGGRTVKLVVTTTGKVKKTLSKKGRARVRLKLTARSSSGATVTKKLKVTLKKIKKKHKR